MNEFWEQYDALERRWGDNGPRRAFGCGSAGGFLTPFFVGLFVGMGLPKSTQSPPGDVGQHVHMSKGGVTCLVAREKQSFALSSLPPSSFFLSVG